VSSPPPKRRLDPYRGAREHRGIRILSLTVVVSLAACGSVDVSDLDVDSAVLGGADCGCDSPSGGEPAGLEGTVAAHNAARAEVGVAPLAWDPALAAIAQAWVEQCQDTQAPSGLVDHNAGRNDHGYPSYVGENIYGSSGGASGVDAVRLWVAEKSNYHHDGNTCDSGEVCGHYTQVVWRGTTKVGCAVHDCAGLTYGSTVVCDYGPGGNSGGSPY